MHNLYFYKTCAVLMHFWYYAEVLVCLLKNHFQKRLVSFGDGSITVRLLFILKILRILKSFKSDSVQSRYDLNVINLIIFLYIQ